MARMLADRHARTVNLHSRLYRWTNSANADSHCHSKFQIDLYRCKVMKRCSSSGRRHNQKWSKAKKMKKKTITKHRRKNRKLWKVRKTFSHREKKRQEREKKKEKKEAKKMESLRRDTKPDFFHIVSNSARGNVTISSTGKLFRSSNLTMHRGGF